MLLDVLISQARSPRFEADAQLQTAYNDKRFVRATKALRSRNIFLYTEGTRTSVNLNNTNTIYTQPTGLRLMVLGYSNNLRYGAATTALNAVVNPSATVFLQQHRVRVIGPNGERFIVADFVPGQAGVAGEPRYTEARLTTPFILEPDEQIAIDLGYDAAGSPEPSDIPPEAFIFFCVHVKELLTADDLAVLDDIKRHINNEATQRTCVLNCNVLGEYGVGLAAGSAANARVNPITPPADAPILITGIGTSLGASRLTITDTRSGLSFSLNRLMQSSALNLPGYENTPDAVPFGAPAVGPNWTAFYTLPMPHLLVRGAQLQADIVNGVSNGASVITEKGLINQLAFYGITV